MKKRVKKKPVAQTPKKKSYEVKGFANKKILGLFPASFAKTVFVSAEDGSIVRTNETLISKFLEVISF